MQHGDSRPGPDGSSPPTPGRLARILMAWTAVLAVAVLADVRSLPPTLVGLLLPYLGLVAWHLRSTGGPRRAEPRSTPADASGVSCTSHDPQVIGNKPGGSDEEIGSSDARGSKSTTSDPSGPPTVEPRNVRGRRRARVLPPTEPAPASWVQVAPGRFVRGEENDPAPDASRDASAGDATGGVNSAEGPTLGSAPEGGACGAGAGDSTEDTGSTTEIVARDGAAAEHEIGRVGRCGEGTTAEPAPPARGRHSQEAGPLAPG